MLIKIIQNKQKHLHFIPYLTFSGKCDMLPPGKWFMHFIHKDVKEN